MADQSEPSVEEFIGMLTEQAESAGDFLTTSRSNFHDLFPSQSFASLWSDPSLSDNTPSIFPEADLTFHIQSIDAEVARSEFIKARLDSASRDPTLVTTVSSVLDARLKAAGCSAAAFNRSELKDLRVKVAYLHHLLEKKGQRDHPHPRFAIHVVTALHLNGRPQLQHIRTLFPPLSASWLDFQRILSDATATWQAAEAGHPHGYTLGSGKWMYYVVRNNIPSENYTSLVNETGYGRMRRLVCEEQVGLLFWHELTARASLALKAESFALADRQSSNPDEEPVDLNGQPYFERFFDFPTDCDKAYMGPPRPRPPVFPNPALLRALSAEETLVKGRIDSGACVPSDFPSVSTSAHPPADVSAVSPVDGLRERATQHRQMSEEQEEAMRRETKRCVSPLSDT
ncbi:hypothetical protein LTR16_003113 [Cryomyces antarcticus]|uniref:Uncharacterized protein n=1 Tax=Cryomyces antarcticus TaxID=329879 RepID=A0ABR0KTT4_9PEZI|nr:hypothetical protein LTR60_002294 [Cryomyces antarcticus]KAK5126193.1 hypothetical protein LTR16_003113 [Cryomyces antarcticus]